MNRVLKIATLLAAGGCVPPATERVFRVREDGGVDGDVTINGLTVDGSVFTPRRADPEPFVRMVRDELAVARPRPRYMPPERPRKDRSKEKAARKARRKNRGR